MHNIKKSIILLLIDTQCVKTEKNNYKNEWFNYVAGINVILFYLDKYIIICYIISKLPKVFGSLKTFSIFRFR